MDDCEEEIVLERTTMWAVAGVWATGNICLIVLIVWYIIELLYTDFDRRQYAKDGEEKLLVRQRMASYFLDDLGQFLTRISTAPMPPHAPRAMRNIVPRLI